MNKRVRKDISLTNYILIGNNIGGLWNLARKKTRDAYEMYPDFFNTESPYIANTMKYVPPFEKDFRELKILQGVAAETAQFYNEYRGYIILDLSEWLLHESDYYLEVSMKFFRDMADNWGYIFILCDTAQRNFKNMIELIASYLCDLPCSYEMVWKEQALRNTLDEMLSEKGSACSEKVKRVIESITKDKVIPQKYLENMICEISQKTGVIRLSSLHQYLETPDTFLRMVCTQSEIDTLIAYVQGKGKVNNDQTL